MIDAEVELKIDTCMETAAAPRKIVVKGNFNITTSRFVGAKKKEGAK